MTAVFTAALVAGFIVCAIGTIRDRRRDRARQIDRWLHASRRHDGRQW